jgi:hypothetical protein
MGVRYNSAMESSAWKYHSDTGLIESPIGFALGEWTEINAHGERLATIEVRYNSAMETACHLNHAQTVK